eukprot:351749-Chlamydomonas_euryale.AAC.2
MSTRLSISHMPACRMWRTAWRWLAIAETAHGVAVLCGRLCGCCGAGHGLCTRHHHQAANPNNKRAAVPQRGLGASSTFRPLPSQGRVGRASPPHTRNGGGASPE